MLNELAFCTVQYQLEWYPFYYCYQVDTKVITNYKPQLETDFVH